VLCTSAIDGLVCNDAVREEYVSSDHKPLAVTFDNLVSLKLSSQDTLTGCGKSTGTVIDWSKADDVCVLNYQMTLNSMLSHLNIPTAVFNECELTDHIRYEIDQYYSFFMSHVMNECRLCLPARQIHPMRDYVIPGWNDIVSDKHKLARDAYLAGSAHIRRRH